ncbi:hypothetical protein EV181_003419 [Coemansia sp. RSA 532]|nr:hypothetical protein EV181_003419 [Coemansia sp. RSA 532]KAJ2199077.1 hypothetical protein IW144_001650 [Coemansia sp. RSA 522]KAJ2274490.1 hypothetical protein GGH14_004078 [Coemansia sp. RSA 370]
MYNGIGLTSARGTGTSGHVVKNASTLRPGQQDGTNRHNDRDRAPKSKPLDKGILDHERKRQVEVKCLELQDKLEDQGLDESEIETRVDELRTRLLQDLEHMSGGRIRPYETQRVAEAKSRENSRMAQALRVDEDYAEGAAFDRELQELKREKRMLERERDREIEDERREERERERGRTRRSSRSRSPRRDSKDKRDRSPRYSRRRRSWDRRRRSRSYSSESDGELHYKSREHSKDRLAESAHEDKNVEPHVGPNVRAIEDGEPGEIEDVEDVEDVEPNPASKSPSNDDE